MRCVVMLNTNDRITPRSLPLLGYKSGGHCKIIIQSRSDITNTPKRILGKSENILTGFMTFVEPYEIINNYCRSLSVIIEIPIHTTNDINHMEYVFYNTTKVPIITLQCILPHTQTFQTLDEVESKFNVLWNSNQGTPILSQFVKHYIPNVLLNTKRTSSNLTFYGKMNYHQYTLLASICSGNHLVTATAPAGTGKTHIISNAVLNGIKHGKTFLIICPTHASCDAFLDNLHHWDPTMNEVLLLRSPSDTINYPDKYNRSDNHYFNQMIDQLYATMDDTDKDIINVYKKCKTEYINLLENAPTPWTDTFMVKIDLKLTHLFITYSMLPSILMKYIKPKIFVSTIDYILGNVDQDYIRNGFDTIIMDDASHIQTYSALILLSKFPNSNICYLGDLTQISQHHLIDTSINEYDKILSSPILQIMKDNIFSQKFELAHNYRSHPQIVEILSVNFYNNELESKTYEMDYRSENIVFTDIEDPNPIYNPHTYPFYLFDISENSSPYSSKLPYKLKEASAIAILLLYLHKSGTSLDKIAVICLHEAQLNEVSTTVTNIFKQYYDHLLTNIPITDVENDFNFEKLIDSLSITTYKTYHGKEIDYVIISTSTSNNLSTKVMANLHDQKPRICSSISRSKKGFFIIGDSKHLGLHCDWSNVIEYLRTRNLVIPFNKQILTTTFKHTLEDSLFVDEWLDKINSL
uniref:Helicase ATP-binding domain-containing protein n=1 Tax=Strongyloides papillosus TaxID=174720 RepID=A0A0N5C2M1_STREA